MNFMATGSIYSYTQNLKLAQNWKIKKSNGNYLQKNSSASTDSANNTVNPELEQFRKQLDQFQQQSNPDLLTLYSKLSSGKKLSSEELAYLREHDPTSYQKAKEMEADRENYKRELKQCRTKEDVERLRTNRMAACFAVASSISHNPNIPKLTKMHLMAAECAKVQAIDEETKHFKASLNYAHMPTDAEKNEEDKKKLEALRGEAGGAQTEKSQEETQTEQTEASERPDQKPAKSDALNPQTNTGCQTDAKKEAPQMTETAKEQPAASQSVSKTDASYHTSYGREVYRQEAETFRLSFDKRRKRT